MLAPEQPEAWQPKPGPIDRAMSRPGVFLMIMGGTGGVVAYDLGLIFGVAGGLIFTIGLMRCFEAKFFSPLITSCFVAFLGLLPQLIFIVAYENSLTDFVEPENLPYFVELYEQLVVNLHQFFKNIGLGPVSSAIINIAMFGLSVWASWTPIPKLYTTAQKWLSRITLALLAGSSFSLASVVPSDVWTPDIPARIQAVRTEGLKTRAELAVARVMLNRAADAEVVRDVSDVHLALVDGDCVMTLLVRCSATQASRGRLFGLDALFTGLSEQLANAPPSLKNLDPARREAALSVMEEVVSELGVAAAATTLSKPSASPGVPPDRPATLATLRSETAKVFRGRDLVEKLQKEIVDALKPKLVFTGDAFADKLLNKLVGHFIDAASTRAMKFATDAAAARGASAILDGDLRLAAERMTLALYGATVSQETRAGLNGKLKDQMSFDAIAATLPKPSPQDAPGQDDNRRGRR